MDDKLLYYYERELTFIRKMGTEFARKYPKIAARLQLEPEKCEDPHTERLIEAFALISGRLHKKIDDKFPEITESLFSIIYPHYITPIPSMSIVKFEPIEQNISPSGYHIDQGTMLFSKPVNGTPCQFSTCYPVDIWPVKVENAGLNAPRKLIKDAQQAILIQLKTFNDLRFPRIKWKKLRFFLNGPSQHVFHLYELLFNNVCHIELESTGADGITEAIILDPGNIDTVGFDPDQGVLPFPKRSFPGYSLLLEYFCFPEKFLFFDLLGLDRIKRLNFGGTLNIWLYLNQTVKTNIVVNKDTFCVNSAPVVNLFNRIAEPIRVENRKTEYRVVPDIRRPEATEVFSVDQVTATSTSSLGKNIEFNPFYSIKHHHDETEGMGKGAFWHIKRRHANKKEDEGTEVMLSFTDLNFKPADPGVEILTVRTTCTNRDLPARLPFGDSSGDFDLEIAAPVERAVCLIKPTMVRRPSLEGALQWRLISHLSLNYLSIVQNGSEAFKEILNLYDFDNSPATRQQIDGIKSIHTGYITKRIRQSFCRGLRIEMEFDETKYVGTGLYLFASVLERFLGQYVSINSFSQLVAKTIQKKEAIKKWPPRTGNQILL